MCTFIPHRLIIEIFIVNVRFYKQQIEYRTLSSVEHLANNSRSISDINLCVLASWWLETEIETKKKETNTAHIRKKDTWQQFSDPFAILIRQNIYSRIVYFAVLFVVIICFCFHIWVGFKQFDFISLALKCCKLNFEIVRCTGFFLWVSFRVQLHIHRGPCSSYT